MLEVAFSEGSVRDIDAIVVPCTNIGTTPEFIADLERRTGVLCVFANPATAWVMAGACGVTPLPVARDAGERLPRLVYPGPCDIA